MTFAREKRLLLGIAALGAALPLPFTEALDWLSLLLFLAVTALFLRRALAGSERWLSRRALNLLGLAYLPVFAFDVLTSLGTRPVRSVLHLILFGLAAKLWSLERERDKWQAWIGIFFVFLASMATSTHPAVVAYLVGFLLFSVLLLLRFVHLHLLSAFSAVRGGAPPLGAWRVTAGIVLATVALAAPLFALLPRVRSPFVVGPGAIGGDAGGPRMGFSDEMTLDLIGRLRANRQIAARVELAGRHPAPGALRLRAGAYEAWTGRTWLRPRASRKIGRAPREGLFRVVQGAPVGSARILLEPLRSTSLPVPVETLAVEVPSTPGLEVSEGGALSLAGFTDRPLEYTALLGARPVSAAPAPDPGLAEGPLDPGGVTPTIAALARDWAGEGSAAERAARIEARLLADYAYSTDFVLRGEGSPIEDFLIRNRRGHCEYFASAMVLLLRAQGIPARLVTGFYGAEWSAWEGTWVIRQSNAHAWVEAHLGEAGWTVFDPTPPDGRPTAGGLGAWSSIRQAWDAVVFRWDRWVISYDFEDQVGVLGGLRSAWDDLVARLFGGGERRGEPAAAAASATATTAAGEDAPAVRRRHLFVAALTLSLAVAAAAAYRLRHRPRWDATAAYLGLRRTLAGAGLAVPDSLPPLALS
ncbi:MAG TPA: DUF3488 and transglutaminase-like domain-containing protein, partial [Thermoanaerobaculia bacterium]|nr:DUF3488 and transglutaminase-like domain-containing protein [Thermoanaerobaculia bacterium]